MNSTVDVNRAIKGELFVVVALEVALVVALHFMGGPAHSVPLDGIGQWFSSTDATTALVAVARLAGLAIGYWLLGTTLLYAAAHRLGWTMLTDLLRWITLPVIRRAVHGMTAMSLTSASLLSPTVMAGPVLADDEAIFATDLGSADQLESGMEPGVEAGGLDFRPGVAGWAATVADDSFWRPQLESAPVTDEGEPEDEYEPGAAGWPDRPADGFFWRPDAASGSGDDTGAGDQTQAGSDVLNQASTTYVVEPTDNFWRIAEEHLRQSVGRSVTEDEVAQYWVRVVEANRDTIRSGDPDLIHPGERITLPEVYGE